MVANGNVSFIESELLKDVFEYELMHDHWLIKYRFQAGGTERSGNVKSKSVRLLVSHEVRYSVKCLKFKID